MPGKLTTNRGGKEKEEIGLACIHKPPRPYSACAMSSSSVLINLFFCSVSGAGSTSAAGADKRRKCSIWPIWTEEELTAEKWVHGQTLAFRIFAEIVTCIYI